MKKTILLFGLLTFAIMLSGCTQPQTQPPYQYVCSDGTIVSNLSLCPSQEESVSSTLPILKIVKVEGIEPPTEEIAQNIQFTHDCSVENNEKIVCEGIVRNLSGEIAFSNASMYMRPVQLINSIECPVRCIEDNTTFEFPELAPYQSVDYRISCLTPNKVSTYITLSVGGIPFAIYSKECPDELFD